MQPNAPSMASILREFFWLLSDLEPDLAAKLRDKTPRDSLPELNDALGCSVQLGDDVEASIRKHFVPALLQRHPEAAGLPAFITLAR